MLIENTVALRDLVDGLSKGEMENLGHMSAKERTALFKQLSKTEVSELLSTISRYQTDYQSLKAQLENVLDNDNVDAVFRAFDYMTEVDAILSSAERMASELEEITPSHGDLNSSLFSEYQIEDGNIIDIQAADISQYQPWTIMLKPGHEAELISLPHDDFILLRIVDESGDYGFLKINGTPQELSQLKVSVMGPLVISDAQGPYAGNISSVGGAVASTSPFGETASTSSTSVRTQDVTIENNFDSVWSSLEMDDYIAGYNLTKSDIQNLFSQALTILNNEKDNQAAWDEVRALLENQNLPFVVGPAVTDLLIVNLYKNSPQTLKNFTQGVENLGVDCLENEYMPQDLVAQALLNPEEIAQGLEYGNFGFYADNVVALELLQKLGVKGFNFNELKSLQVEHQSEEARQTQERLSQYQEQSSPVIHISEDTAYFGRKLADLWSKSFQDEFSEVLDLLKNSNDLPISELRNEFLNLIMDAPKEDREHIMSAVAIMMYETDDRLFNQFFDTNDQFFIDEAWDIIDNGTYIPIYFDKAGEIFSERFGKKWTRTNLDPKMKIDMYGIEISTGETEKLRYSKYFS